MRMLVGLGLHHRISVPLLLTRLYQSSSFSMEARPMTFGVISDVQWADIPDGSNYSGSVTRKYRGAFQNLREGVNWWLDHRVHFVAQLGDIIDGKNEAEGTSERCLNLALQELNRLPCPVLNLVGNHELYNFDRAQLAGAKWLRHGDKEYYAVSYAEGWRTVVLDSYQIALIGHDPLDPRRTRAVELLAEMNPNVHPDGVAGDWFKGMKDAGTRKRFVPYNGGFGQEQLGWLAAELADAKAKGEKVIVLSHVVLHPQASGGSTLVWDYEDALKVLRKEDCVVAVLCGHDHSGNYHCDEFGVHHCTFSSPLNKGDQGQAFGLIHCTNESLEIRGPKIDDLLPNVEGRPHVQPCTGDDISGPCQSLMLPINQLNKLGA